MFLPVCIDCAHGGVKDGRSFCERETVYSDLTRCMQKKALAYYLEENTLEVFPERKAVNQ